MKINMVNVSLFLVDNVIKADCIMAKRSLYVNTSTFLCTITYKLKPNIHFLWPKK